MKTEPPQERLSLAGLAARLIRLFAQRSAAAPAEALPPATGTGEGLTTLQLLPQALTSGKVAVRPYAAARRANPHAGRRRSCASPSNTGTLALGQYATEGNVPHTHTHTQRNVNPSPLNILLTAYIGAVSPSQLRCQPE